MPIKLFSLTKLMVSRDLPRSTVTKQITFDQRDLHSTPVFGTREGSSLLRTGSKLETLDPSLLPVFVIINVSKYFLPLSNGNRFSIV